MKIDCKADSVYYEGNANIVPNYGLEVRKEMKLDIVVKYIFPLLW